MPIVKTSFVIRLARDVCLSFRVEAALTGLRSTINQFRSRSGKSSSLAPSLVSTPPVHSQQATPAQSTSPAQTNIQLAEQRHTQVQSQQQLKRKYQDKEQVRQRQKNKSQELEAEEKSRQLEEYYQLIKHFHEKTLEIGYGDLRKYRWYHTIDLGSGLVTPGLYDHRPNLPAFKFPANMEGMNVLDVGSATGFFAFEFEKRGANVTSVELPFGTPADVFPGETPQQTRKRVEREYRRLEKQLPSQAASSAEKRLDLVRTGTPEERYHFHNDGPFKFCHKVLNSKVQRHYSSIYDLSEAELGRDNFDLVFLGDILIHTIDPLKALASVTSLCRGTLVISQDIPEGPYPVMTYIAGDKAGEDRSSWWKPNRLCFEQMLKKLGFREVAVVGEHAGFIKPDMAPYKRSVLHATVN